MSSPIRPPLTVEEADGTPSGRPINKIVVSNGTLSISGTTATIQTGGAGGGGTVTSVSSSQAFITITNPTTTPSISIGNASGAATGVLTSSDWTTFNSKQDSLTLTTTGTSGAATLVGSTLNIPQYSGGGGGIGGSITDNQVAVGAATSDEIEGYSDFTYNDSTSTLTVGEKIDSAGTSQLQLIAGSSNIAILDSGVANHINITPASGRINAQASTLSVGTNSGDSTISSKGAYNLTLNTNDGTNSGSIVIQDGVNGQISITPNGTGTIKLDGVELDNSAIQTGYVLKATSATAAGWAAESGGGGSPGGSDTNVQFNDSSAFGGSGRFKFDPDVGGSGSAGMGLKNSGDAFLSSGFVAYIEGNTFISSQVFGNEFLASTSSASDVAYGFQIDQNTGIANSAADQIDIVTGGSYNISFGANKEILLGGTAAGSAGQVLTSGGSGSAVSWSTVGGGSSDKPNSLAAGLNNVNSELLGVGYNAPADGTPNSYKWANSLSRIRPHVMLQAGTLDKGYLWFSNAPTGASSQTFTIGLWNAGTDNKIGTLKATCQIEIGVGGTTGIKGQDWVAETGEDLDITVGGVYWVGFYGMYGASSQAAGLYFLQQSGISLFPARQSLDNTGATKNLTRVYASGDPSTIGDNPTPLDGDTQTNAVWPYMWYDLT